MATFLLYSMLSSYLCYLATALPRSNSRLWPGTTSVGNLDPLPVD